VVYSALMELRGSVEVEMKHVVSGVQVRGQAHIDLPLTISISTDLEKSKVHAKIKDMVKYAALVNYITDISSMPN